MNDQSSLERALEVAAQPAFSQVTRKLCISSQYRDDEYLQERPRTRPSRQTYTQLLSSLRLHSKVQVIRMHRFNMNQSGTFDEDNSIWKILGRTNFESFKMLELVEVTVAMHRLLDFVKNHDSIQGISMEYTRLTR